MPVKPMVPTKMRSLSRPTFSRPTLVFGTLVLSLAVAIADDWPGPQVREVFSASRDYFVRVVPGDSWGDTFGFAGSKKGPYARAEFYRREDDRSYRLTAEVTLLNPVAPVEFFVSNDGRLATLDNWHNRGYGAVVAIYGREGSAVKSYALDDLFSPAEIEGFSHSVSSIRWHQDPAYVRDDQRTLLVTVESGSDFLFGLETGAFKFCETKDKAYRCRNANENRKWQTNAAIPLTR